jgi:hypothetical protein
VSGVDALYRPRWVWLETGGWTWLEIAMFAGWPEAIADYALWNCTAFPCADARTVWSQLWSSWRLAQLAGRLPDSVDGGFR